PPAPGLADDAVRPHQRARREADLGPVPPVDPRGDRLHRLAEGPLRLAEASDEGEGLFAERGVVPAGGPQVSRALVGRAREGLVEEGIEALPVLGGEVLHGDIGYAHRRGGGRRLPGPPPTGGSGASSSSRRNS